MLQFRAHWLGQDTLEQFKTDFAARMWLAGFTHLFSVVRLLNTDLEDIESLAPTPTDGSTFGDSLRFQLDQHLKRGATVDEFRMVKSEILGDVLLLIDPDASVEARDKSLFAIVQKVNAMELPATWELQDAAPYKVHFKFPPWTEILKRPDELLQFREGLMVFGAAWGQKNAPKNVQVVKTENRNLSRLGRGAGRVLELHGYRWIVRRWFVEPKDFRQDIYSSLISSLEDGSFARLGRCHQCSLFFIAQDGKQDYCSKQCSREFTNADAKNRVRRYRKNLQKRRSEEHLEAYLQKLVRAEAKDLKGELLPVYKQLGGPQEGRKFVQKLQGKSWRDLSRPTQTKISAISKEHPL